MFHSLARNATAAASPVKISGVARVSVSRNANCVPAAPLMTAANTANGEAPPSKANKAAITKLATTATNGAIAQTLLAASVRGSSRIGLTREAVARHHQAEVTDGHVAPRHRRRHAAAIHHDHPIRQREQLVEVLGDQQDAGAGSARLQQLLMDVADCADVEAAGRLVGEDDARAKRHLAAQD